MINVLIVEDDPMVRHINEVFLNKITGVKLYESVGSIETAKKVIRSKKPDLILLDVFFPDSKGTDLLKWLRLNELTCDVILITADRSIETVEEAFRYGVVDYLIKPFAFERFKEALLQYKERKNFFENTEDIQQDMLDHYILNQNKESMEQGKLEKGFNQYTYQNVMNYIKNNKKSAFTSQEIADALGISRITTRRYLEMMVKENKMTMELKYGIGRPKNIYRKLNT